MGRFAKVIDGIVDNIAKADHAFAVEHGWIEVEPEVSKGWLYDGQTFTAPPPEPIDPGQVKAERDRRLKADFEFQGKLFQRDSKSLDRITGAATLAGFAIAGGAQPGNLRWANPDRDFGWIASDDTVVPMDAQTAFAFGQAAAARETSIIFAAKMLREMDPIPTDFADEKWWP